MFKSNIDIVDLLGKKLFVKRSVLQLYNEKPCEFQM